MGLDILCETKLLWLVVGAGILGTATAQGTSCTCAGGCDNNGITSSDGREVNVAYGKSASMSGTGFSDTQGQAGPACVAVNGRTSVVYRSLNESDTNCIHSSKGDYQPWWEVNLGQNYTVAKLVIYRRGGPFTLRMANIDVLVGNTVCYSFPSSSDNNTLYALPGKIDISCNQPLTGQVVKLEKRTRNIDGFYYFLNICEVQVWVCTQGYYGNSCQNCGRCKNGATCNVETGVCPDGCQPGWRNQDCQTECEDGTYGDGCSSTCGNCSVVCNKENGTCPGTCQPGFDPSDRLCKTRTSCTCAGSCGNDGLTSADGREVNVAYWKSASMSGNGYSDGQGTAGPACVAINGRTSVVYRTLSQSDTNCIQSSGGDYQPWWEVNLGQTYTVTKLTIYRRGGAERRMANMNVLVGNTMCYSFPSSSDNSALDALPEKIDISCNQPLMGHVVKLEKRTWSNVGSYYFLNICEVQVWVCAHGYYGNSCQNNCGRCKNGLTCNVVTGMCPDGCQPGWRNQDCQTECEDGTYGDGCSSTCGNCSVVCNKEDGTCPSVCQPGFDPSDRLCKTRTLCTCDGGCGNNGITSADGREVNVAYGKSASMSGYGYSDKQSVAGPACVAINGRTSVLYRTLSQSDTNCIHSREGDYQPWWEVNLGQNYTVAKLIIYRRRGAERRMANMNILVGNTMCYSFPSSSDNSALDALPEKIDISCNPPLTGHVVKLEKRTANRNGLYYFLNICEVQVWVCAHGYYGNSCQNNCGQCKNGATCNVETGMCPDGCQHGWRNQDCQTECEDGTYGDGCSSTCGNCSVVCNREDGTCPSVCQPGFDPSDRLCKTLCRNGTFGNNCSQNCSETCGGSGRCDLVSGQCNEGCKAGFIPGDNGMCRTVCRNGTFGNNCSQNCSETCGGSGRCDLVSGQCNEGCKAGFIPGDNGMCRTVCRNGTFGNNCSQNCSETCGGSGRCDLVSGQCNEGCKAGFIPGDNGMCRTVCRNGTFGNNCSQNCSETCGGSGRCDLVSGQCNEGCKAGFIPGDNGMCRTVCRNGTFGNNCSQNCSETCGGSGRCDLVSGQCNEGCKAGFIPGDNGMCRTVCRNGTFGNNCSQNCSETCGGSGRCDLVSGQCNEGCKAGFIPGDNGMCRTVCRNGTFGSSCSQNCSETCGGSGSCDPVSGQCNEGCKAGFIPGDNGMCRTECANGTYGTNCASNCGKCVGICNKVSGSCSGGCQSGFDPSDSFCIEPCKNGTFGDACNQNCSRTCGGSGDCDSVSGRCMQGCNEGFTSGDDGMCRHKNIQSSGDDSNVGAIVGPAVGVVILIVIAVVAACMIIRWRRKKEALAARSLAAAESTDTVNTRKRSQETMPSFDPISQESDKSIMKQKAKKARPREQPSHVYYNVGNTAVALQHSTSFPPSAASGSAPSPPSDPELLEKDSSSDYSHFYSTIEEERIYASFKATQPRLDIVQKYLVDRLASGELDEEFSQKIEKIKEELEQNIAVMSVNRKKNRCASVLPYDQNRVTLKDGYTKNGATDFVNASYISGYYSANQYIASQGPLNNTVIDFWRMIWQEGITFVVMLTNLQDDDKNKCYLYWPEDEGSKETYGPVSVTTTREECRDSFYIRTLTVKKRQESRQVTQYHYVSWPVHGVPTTTSLVSFWRHVTSKTRQSGDMDCTPPLLVHCSSGVGRTGTYIGLDIGLDTAVSRGRVNVFELVQRLRVERCLMVQTPDQYSFLHKVLLEAYFAHGTNISLDHFHRIYPKQICSASSNSRIDEEFQSLMHLLSLTPEHRHDSAMQEENIAKNRNPDVLPSEDHLIYLTEQEGGRNQYINAIFVPTFWDAKGSVVTQLPLASTLIDFWRLVYGNDITTIVSLISRDEEKQLKDYIQYWPPDEGRTMQSGPHQITLSSKSQQPGSGLTKYSLSLKKKGVSQPRTIQLLHYKGWTGEVGGKVADILHLIDTLATIHNVSETSRLLVQCSDGVGKSGLFCALCDIINHMTHDGEIDVFMTVRHIQTISPKAVSSVVQYRYCYEVVQSRIQELDSY